ncbi:lipase family protein [Planotetraspora sp. A-T 1434]|uniref:lipase family protein n=1 Tax=Planotetraspora sp. A-T 1434 TaxID=2979219 RepID=UPI0021C0A3D0|nr:lipase family protein [Planotetraspora sp. A-T 1434]MCT9930023.1 lipase family protein [Planotetraspora sp. A-T 1434]
MNHRVRATMSMILSTVGALLLLPALGGTARSTSAGDVVEARPTTVYLAPGKLLEVPVKTWHILYRSTSATGASNVVSGTLLVPNSPYPLGRRPIAGYAVGTHGMGDQCAPSAAMANGTEAELAFVSLMLLKGWAVAVTDYEGLGTPGDHTYMAGISQGHAVLDAIRAAIRLPEAKLSGDAPVVVMGYSQGGSSAAWAAQLQPSYAPELRLKGVAAGGVPADLQAVADHLDGTDDFGLAAAAGVGLDAAYPELRLNSYLTPEGAALFDDARDDCVAELRSKLAGRHLSDLTTTDVMHRPDWQARLRENRLGAASPRVPLFLYHAKGDEIIPYGVDRTLRDEYCARGVKVLWKGLPAGSHVLGAVEGGPLAVGWLANRVLGLPALTNC